MEHSSVATTSYHARCIYYPLYCNCLRRGTERSISRLEWHSGRVKHHLTLCLGTSHIFHMSERIYVCRRSISFPTTRTIIDRCRAEKRRRRDTARAVRRSIEWVDRHCFSCGRLDLYHSTKCVPCYLFSTRARRLSLRLKRSP